MSRVKMVANSEPLIFFIFGDQITIQTTRKFDAMPFAASLSAMVETLSGTTVLVCLSVAAVVAAVCFYLGFFDSISTPSSSSRLVLAGSGCVPEFCCRRRRPASH